MWLPIEFFTVCSSVCLLPVSQAFVLNPITTVSEPEGCDQQVGLGGYSAMGREDVDEFLWEEWPFLCPFCFISLVLWVSLLQWETPVRLELGSMSNPSPTQPPRPAPSCAAAAGGRRFLCQYPQASSWAYWFGLIWELTVSIKYSLLAWLSLWYFRQSPLLRFTA